MIHSANEPHHLGCQSLFSWARANICSRQRVKKGGLHECFSYATLSTVMHDCNQLIYVMFILHKMDV